MSLIRRKAEGEKDNMEPGYNRSQSSLSTALASIFYRLDQLERRVESLEGFLVPARKVRVSTLISTRGSESAGEFDQLVGKKSLLVKRIDRGKTIRPFKGKLNKMI